MTTTHWLDNTRTACRDYPHLFDDPPPHQHPDITRSYQQTALEMCWSCPVMLQCQQTALAHGIVDNSIVGGQTGLQRRQLTSHINNHLNPRDITGECRRGHPISSRYYAADGFWRCRECAVASAKRRRQKRQQQRQQEAAA